MMLDAVSINEELSGLLDYSRQDVKKFIKEFVQRVESQRNLEAETKKVMQKADRVTKQIGSSSKTQKSVTVRDLSKVKLQGRAICYCMCTLHPLVNNCVSCGKIVCEQEGEGPCMFCGNWVDRETMYDLNELGEAEEEEKKTGSRGGRNLALQYELAL